MAGAEVHAASRTCLALALFLGACARDGDRQPQVAPARPAAIAGAAPLDSARPIAEAAAACMHWPGEEPYDKARALEIEAGISRDCPKAAALLKGDLALVKRSPALAAAALDLVAHFGEEHGFGPLAPELGALCAGAVEHYRARLAERPAERYFPYFDQRCPEQARALCGPAGCGAGP